MSTDTDADDGDAAALSPDEAFSALGNETRIRILERLGDVDEPLSFSELHDCVDVRDSAQFNYHLKQLVGHFVEKSDDGYELYPAGRRVVEAILSGAVTDAPVLELTPIDQDCHFCGTQVEMRYSEERLSTYCPNCSGTYGRVGDGVPVPDDYGYLGYRPLPPAGLRDRTPTEAHRAAHTWNVSERLPAASGVCPRCSARLEESVDVCDAHDAVGGQCDQCGQRYAVQHAAECTNCIFEQRGAFVVNLLSNTDLLSFLTDHGVNPISPTAPSASLYTSTVMNYEERDVETDPFSAQFAFTIDEETLTLTVDDELEVVEARRERVEQR